MFITDSQGKTYKVRLTLKTLVDLKRHGGIDLAANQDLVLDIETCLKIIWIAAGAPDDFDSFMERFNLSKAEEIVEVIQKAFEEDMPGSDNRSGRRAKKKKSGRGK